MLALKYQAFFKISQAYTRQAFTYESAFLKFVSKLSNYQWPCSVKMKLSCVTFIRPKTQGLVTMNEDITAYEQRTRSNRFRSGLQLSLTCFS